MKTFILFILTAFCLNLNAQDNLICKYTMESTINDSIVCNVIVSITTGFKAEGVYENTVIGDSIILFKLLDCNEITIKINSGEKELKNYQEEHLETYYTFPMLITSVDQSELKAHKLRTDYCNRLHYKYIAREQRAYKFRR